MNLPPNTLSVWRFSDGKPGHDNQSRGLVNALARRLELECYDFSVSPFRISRTLAWLRGVVSGGDTLPAPDLLIGAGHSTHLPLLTAARRYGGRHIVLMKPSLPIGCFELCIIPEHDGLPAAPGRLITRGMLNRIQGNKNKEADRGLILVGGPSRHHGWDAGNLIMMVRKICQRSPDIQWTVANSRRTPAATLRRLQQLESARLTVVPWDTVDSNWLPEALSHSATVWVSEDSASMVYEALTAGAATGLLPIPRLRDSRISHGVSNLVRDGLLTPYAAWIEGASLCPPEHSFNEAERVADWMIGQWQLGA